MQGQGGSAPPPEPGLMTSAEGGVSVTAAKIGASIRNVQLKPPTTVGRCWAVTETNAF